MATAVAPTPSVFTGKRMSDALIAELMGKGRARNAYSPKLDLFMASDEPVVEVADIWPVEFGKKQGSTLYQGFLSAIKKLENPEMVQCKRIGEKVYLLHTERVAALDLAA